MPPPSTRATTTYLALALAALVCFVYAGVGENGFVSLDDGAYVYANPPVLAGLTPDSIGWALGATHSANWHPLTWLSHMLDVQWFGLDAGMHHWMSVWLHALNTVLLFLVLRALTGAAGRSALVAALFAVHPLHVESVAWVAERKDVLSTLFWILALGAYARFARARTLLRYLVVAGCLALGLLAKSMLVTVPFVLLLLDFWPLGRWKPGAHEGGATPLALVLEKLPLLALSAVAGVIAVAAQSGSGAAAALADYPLGERISNAVVAYSVYLRNMLWPDALAAFYPDAASLGEQVPIGQVVGAAALLLAISALVVWQFRRRPYLAFGWAWYLGTLVPVIGIVQVGSQALADRYTYVPLIGIFVALVWLAGDALDALRCKPVVARVAAAALLTPLSIVSLRQVGYWRDNTTLFERALAVTDRNWLAWNSLGVEQLEHAELERALASFEEALRILPDYADASYNAGLVHLQRLDRERASAAFERALAIDPRHLDAWNSLGVAQLNLGRYPEALKSCATALEIDPDYPPALMNMALAHALRGERAEFEAFERRLRAVDPRRADELLAQERSLGR